MIRVFLVDDHAVLRTGIRNALALRDGILVVGEASNGLELLEQLPQTPADVVVLDLNMPGMGGMETLRELRTRFPEVRSLVLSMLENEQYMHQALDLGAQGYMLKSAGIDELVLGIETAAAGRPFLSVDAGLEALRKLRDFSSTPTEACTKEVEPEECVPALSQREREVLQLIAEGYTNQEIADKLFTSKRTIETHRQNILEKTNMKNTAALVRYAMNAKLVS